MPSTSCQSWDLQLGLCLRCDLPKDLNTIFTQKTEGNDPVQVCLQKGIQFLHEVKNFARAMSHIHLMVFFWFPQLRKQQCNGTKGFTTLSNRGIQHEPETLWVNLLASSSCVSWLWIPSRSHVISESPKQLCLISWDWVSDSIRPSYLVDWNELRVNGREQHWLLKPLRIWHRPLSGSAYLCEYV